MTSPESHQSLPERNFRQTVLSVYDECRLNIDKYDSPSGIPLEVGGTSWIVTYWPSWEGHAERLSITRDFLKHENPVSYSFGLDGTVKKYEVVKKHISGGAYFDTNEQGELRDQDELETLKAIVIAAHTIHTK